MGISTAELYNNLGLCCFYAQQYDMTITCLQVTSHHTMTHNTMTHNTMTHNTMTHDMMT